MAEYRITDESKAKAKDILLSYAGMMTTGLSTAVAINRALNALCVPVEPSYVRKLSTCHHCGWDIYLQRNGVWYHKATQNVFCNRRPGLDGFPMSCKAGPPDYPHNGVDSISNFGPGTRLRASNGDELLVVRHGHQYMLVNLTFNLTLPNIGSSLAEIVQAQVKDGAIIIE